MLKDYVVNETGNLGNSRSQVVALTVADCHVIALSLTVLLKSAEMGALESGPLCTLCGYRHTGSILSPLPTHPVQIKMKIIIIINSYWFFLRFTEYHCH